MPLWPSLRGVLPPGKPQPNTPATHWPYQVIRPLLLKASYHIDGCRQSVKPGRGERAYARGGLAPMPVFERSSKAYPMIRYPWVEARAALDSLAQDQPELEAVQLGYVNPETGAPVENILGSYALMLRPGQILTPPVRGPAKVFHLIEGGATVQVQDQSFKLLEANTCCAPGYTPVSLANASASAAAFFFIADETPLHQKLGLFENRG